MKRIAALLLASLLVTLILAPVTTGVNNHSGNERLIADGGAPAPPFPNLIADGGEPAPPFPNSLELV